MCQCKYRYLTALIVTHIRPPFSVGTGSHCGKAETSPFLSMVRVVVIRLPIDQVSTSRTEPVKYNDTTVFGQSEITLLLTFHLKP